MMNSILPIRFSTVAAQGYCVIKPERLTLSNNEKLDNNLKLKEMSAAIQKASESVTTSNVTIS